MLPVFSESLRTSGLLWQLHKHPTCYVSEVVLSLLCLDRLCALRGVGWGALRAKGLQACPGGSVPMETGGADGATLWGEEGGTDQSCGDVESEQTQEDATSSGFLRSLGTLEAGLGDG